MKIQVFDIEANGLNPTKIWCLAHSGGVTSEYEEMRKFFSEAEVLVGHNIVRFDIPVCERILGIKIKAKLVDTLALSWYLEPNRLKHGLEEWGEEFGIPKPIVEDWDNLPIEEYMNRCQEDVKINTKLWNKQQRHLTSIYGSVEECWRIIDYLSFKMDCARQQEADRWKLDVGRATTLLKDLSYRYDEKVTQLIAVMPKKKIIKVRTKPPKMYLKGKLRTLTKAGEAWYDLLSRVGLPEDYEGPVEETVALEDGKPSSHEQVKKWLYDLGWEPLSFEFKRDKETNEVRKIPQVKNKFDDSGGICPSIKALYDKEPNLEILDGMSVLAHRIGIVEGFIENVDDEGYLKAEIGGLTNTLRFKHRVIVNLPGVDKPFGADIRGCLIAPEGYELCGSDMSSLEDKTGLHYTSQFDKDIIVRKSEEGYDPHIEMCVMAGLMTKDEAEFFKWYKKK